MLSVILKSSIRGLGKAGEVAKVRPGYARYLLADGKAMRATKRNMELLAEKLAVMEEESNQKLREAEKVEEALAGECFVMIRQASDDGKLFGSVAVRDVAKLLGSLGYNVQPKEVFFSEVIKRIGEYEINVELHADLVAVVKLYVVRNEAEAERTRLQVARDRKSRNAAAASEVQDAPVEDGGDEVASVDSVAAEDGGADASGGTA
ncbi:50S ribosomal protein L9 [Anaplasma phagocytophilum]|uniref:Large ribosomal subunit protein bL9 n=1 Tax=Anaplasma phagocytophilum TaxID=948 RepID=A0AA45USR2_ANAPH|nr:50S ribosomal protein L9 [Anaplasma phagocytophilum]SBO14303.1 50S ribosomal protein L9 [Anaplasma phagocytophilum]